uniref:T cell receptor alpha variable 4 n=1 Tax=Oryctolagus cuniculus TaxID=9986 RepID=G1TYX0_RABIT
MREVTRVTVLLALGAVSLSKTTQPSSMGAYEGQNVNISCSHPNIDTNEYIFWYQQIHNQGPRFLIQGYKTNVQNEEASLLIAADRKSSTLGLARLSLRDTAVYYCTVVTHSEADGSAPVQYLLWGGAHSLGEVQKQCFL